MRKVPYASMRLGLRLVLALALLCSPAPGFARDASGGYSRPSFGPSSSSYRRPSAYPSSGGYSRPSGGFSPGYSGTSPGDVAASRRASSEALEAFRRSQTPPPPPPVRRPSPSPWGAPAPSPWTAPEPRRPSAYGWNAPATPSAGFSGALTGVALWALLNSLSQPGRADYFYNNRNDPRYQEWREEANREAANNPEIAAKLRQLDAQMAQIQNQEQQPPAARPAPSSSGGGFWFVLFVLAALFVLLWVWRRRSATGQTAKPAALSGSKESRFRVGMTFPIDPAPFLLAQSATKVQPPAESGMISAEAVALLQDGAIALHRLYLPGRTAFFQIHLGPDGRPDECRYFSSLDQVTPADANEWQAWLDPAQGMIGWPAFQTKDGKTYGRAWAPGDAKIPPREIRETLQALDGVSERKHLAMLYAAPTGAASPAPQTEYVLVSAIEIPGQAWVEIHVGIDVNPATLSLPSVPLAA